MHARWTVFTVTRTNLTQGAEQQVGSGFRCKLARLEVHVDNLQPRSIDVHLAYEAQAAAGGAGDDLLVDELGPPQKDAVGGWRIRAGWCVGLGRLGGVGLLGRLCGGIGLLGLRGRVGCGRARGVGWWLKRGRGDARTSSCRWHDWLCSVAKCRVAALARQLRPVHGCQVAGLCMNNQRAVVVAVIVERGVCSVCLQVVCNWCGRLVDCKMVFGGTLCVGQTHYLHRANQYWIPVDIVNMTQDAQVVDTPTASTSNADADAWHARYQFFLWPPLEGVAHKPGQEVYVSRSSDNATGRAVVIGPPVPSSALPPTWMHLFQQPCSDDQPHPHAAKLESVRCPIQYVCCGVRYVANTQRLLRRYAFDIEKHTARATHQHHICTVVLSPRPHCRYRAPGAHRVLLCYSTVQYRLLAKTQVGWDDHVVELGSSFGLCTEILASRAASVVGFEVRHGSSMKYARTYIV